MIVKKAGGAVIGGHLSKAERIAMEIEVKKYLAELIRDSTDNIDASVLWVLHSEFGFGKKKLKQFRDVFLPKLSELTDYYEMGDTDRAWLCRKNLLDNGIDIEKL